jgi:flagellar hook-associated protein 2
MHIEDYHSMAITPLTFTGVSTFSNDFQTILNRAVSIASLPAKALQNKQTDLLQEKQLTTSLESVVSDLANSVSNLGALGSNQALVGNSSDSTKVAVNSASGSTPVSHSITNITSVAKAASESSLTGYADATAATVSSTGTVELFVGGSSKQFTLAAGKNNLAGLRDAINAQGLGVTASVLTTGTGLTPFYLSISASSTGQNALQLVDDPNGTPTQLLTATNPGANAVFKVDGVNVTSTTNLINSVISGITFTIVKQTDPAETVTLSTATDSTQLSSALKDFVAKYNAVTGQLNGQIGSAAGLLSGNSLIWGLQSELHGLVNHNGTGAIKSLAELGIELDNTGKMSFNQDTTDPTRHVAFNSLSSAQIAGAFSFLGSATTGFGALSSRLTQYSDPITGTIKSQQDLFDAADKRLTGQVNTITNRANAMQKSLSAKLQAADALIASLTAQQQLLNASLQSASFAAFGAPFTSGNNSSGA